ncbi:MAG: phospho-N-acetylmuramoyl-pentapeptide-transferase [Chloroflexi bacterium]|nr:MAG: phospho-N-acetylmuramoyl-pentapeptide-transferase [Anaerolineaceae bacterium 4572_32.2]RLC78686.1 MAG: phospho-N-acetylmuramoyl-pentapeptide-transferase [Chloroflexota bacterium]RLC86458.1 MAG: phospho-N-acetylmuramoyl-pentapeptide-transferase [Chloroflexota bacterium]HEY71836.1 phospho-N-acetylmuramoyl-pentapeptide-transferase [Thermoflexia bacterium]
MKFALILASISFILAVGWGPLLMRILRRYKIGKRIRIEGPRGHRTKLGTPTMGGLMIVVPVVLITLALNAYNLLGQTVIGRSILIPLGVMLAYGLIGAADDVAGVRGMRRGEGYSARRKLLWEIPLTLGVAAIMLVMDLQFAGQVGVPGIHRAVDLGWAWVPIAAFIILSSANTVNLTDGLDGLAGIIVASAFAAYGVIALLQGQVYLVHFCFTVVGACFAFLWYNAHPAQMFMGDTGSLALGATLGAVALMTGQWLLLPIVALIPVAEGLSVILQVAYFKYTKRKYGQGRRLFKMSPLHHHFELLGWSETQVVQRFWLVGLLAAMAGVALALL